MKIVTVAEVPAGLQADWLQHLRDFDTAHPGCHFQVVVDAHDQSVAEAMATFQKITPGFAFTSVIPMPKA